MRRREKAEEEGWYVASDSSGRAVAAVLGKMGWVIMEISLLSLFSPSSLTSLVGKKKGLNSESSWFKGWAGTAEDCGVVVLFRYSVTATLCDPMDCSRPGSPALHRPQEFARTHVQWVGDAVQPSHPLSSPSPPAFNLSQHLPGFSLGRIQG